MQNRSHSHLSQKCDRPYLSPKCDRPSAFPPIELWGVFSKGDRPYFPKVRSP
ncbi:hypothetical protein [Microcoleus sp. POL10_C6]|uniref:hypothetical protein n=1 Tax=Microcoleus sp. POL10_C6 TaxID=2818852 RepID=UPI002FCF2ECF